MIASLPSSSSDTLAPAALLPFLPSTYGPRPNSIATPLTPRRIRPRDRRHRRRPGQSFPAQRAAQRRDEGCPLEIASTIHSRPFHRRRAGLSARCRNPSPSLPRLLAFETLSLPKPLAPDVPCLHSGSAQQSPHAHLLSSTEQTARKMPAQNRRRRCLALFWLGSRSLRSTQSFPDCRVATAPALPQSPRCLRGHNRPALLQTCMP